MLGRGGRKGQGAGATKRTANEGIEKVSTKSDGGSKMQNWEKGTRFRDGELGGSHAHGFGWSQNKLIYDTYRKSGNRVERREKEKDRPLHTPSWPSNYWRLERDRHGRSVNKR